MKILHITPHLGGGVGRVLSQVTMYNATHKTGIEEEFICLENPEKFQCVDAIQNGGVKVTIEPNYVAMQKKIGSADIVQLEWWHHPLMAKWLQDASGMETRLAIWSHTSGLHYPAFPKGFPELPHAFMATTAASPAGAIVPSSGGFNDISAREEFNLGSPRYGYIGSLNSAKLHPCIMEFLAAANIAVEFFGDSEVGSPLRKTPNIKLMGYTDNPAAALKKMDVFIYLLNPLHYGTTENALLEAMAAGVVPIVLNNAVESSIVTHGETGMVVDSPENFTKAIRQLENPDLRQRMAKAAASDIRQRFSLESTVNGLQQQYKNILTQKPRKFAFSQVFGETPFDWFMAGLGGYAPLFAPGAEVSKRGERAPLPFLYEKNKSSLAQFARYFPKDPQLQYWLNILVQDKQPAYKTG